MGAVRTALLVVVLVTAMAWAALESSQLRPGDLPGLSRTYQGSLGPFWPQVERLPEALRSPDRAPQSMELESQVVLGNFKLEGLRNVWGEGPSQVTIDSGLYTRPAQAQDALSYMVWKGAAPVYHLVYFPCHPLEYTGANQPVPGGVASERPTLREARLGDRAYEVVWPTSSAQLEREAAAALCRRVTP